MARMTKAQLIDENTALRNSLERLEAQVAELRAAQLQMQRPAQHSAFAERVCSTYTKRDGSRWVKVQIGWNRYEHRRVA